MERKNAPTQTAWQKSGRWYDDLVGAQGHYYHQHVILPNLARLLEFGPNSSLIDLGCGQGVLARAIPKNVNYVGVDLSKTLIQEAKKYHIHDKNRKFLLGDITKTLPLTPQEKFTHATLILSLQNIETPEKVFQMLAPHLSTDGKLVLVLNHPAFRIPRQSGWGEDEKTRTQYRKVNAYMTPQKIPIQMHPGQKESTDTTWSFHHPLSAYSLWLKQNGFVIELMEEWISDKVSTGSQARQENRARKEFPLFLAIVARLI
jgi:ubiquinone/menaquinone biosynthesis C-methylase UbiE